jgi:hypothetical protein
VWRNLGLAFALVLAPVAASAQVDMSAPPSESTLPQPDHVQRDPVETMFDNFSISLIAAQKCKPPPDALMNRFVQNLMIVQQVAVNHYRKLLPDKSVNDVVEMLNTRVQNLDAATTSAIQAKGCTDPEIVKLVETFSVNASIDFSAQR